MYISSQSKYNVMYSNGIAVAFSYGVPVAAFILGRGWFRTTKKWSNTTTRHINKFLKDHHVQEDEVEEVSQFVLEELL